MNMRIKTTSAFREKVKAQIRYIAKDKPVAARKLKVLLDEKILELPFRPFSFRISPFFDDPNIREIIIHGYKITFRISHPENLILLFSFTQWDEPSQLP